VQLPTIWVLHVEKNGAKVKVQEEKGLTASCSAKYSSVWQALWFLMDAQRFGCSMQVCGDGNVSNRYVSIVVSRSAEGNQLRKAQRAEDH